MNMSKKNLARTRIHLLLAIALLVSGFVPGVWAQPASPFTLSTTISFGPFSGGLDMSYFNAGVPFSDPVTATISSGSSTYAASSIFGTQYGISSSISDVVTTVSLPGSTPFSITQPTKPGVFPSFVPVPVGPDPGLTLASSFTASANTAPPFYNLFPPPAGTLYGGTFAPPATVQPFYADGVIAGPGYAIKFTGSEDLILGEETQTGPDSFSYADSEIVLSTAITSENDPHGENLDLFGTVTISAAAAPDSAPGLAGVLTLLAVCAGGAWRKARAA